MCSFLFFKRNAAQTEFVRQGALVSGLQQAGAEFAVNLDASADDLLGKLVDFGVHNEN